MAALLAATATATSPAHAEAPTVPDATQAEGDDEAWRAVYEEGKVHYRLREYRQAVAKFTEAYRQSQRPQLLFNIAQAHRLAGDCASASRFYRTFLDANPEAEAAPVEARIAEMDACVARAARNDEARDDWKIKVWALSGAGLGVILAGAGTVLMLSARDDAAAVQAACTPGDPCVWSEQAARDDNWRSNERLGGTLLIAGGGLVAIGGGLLLWRWLAGDDAPDPGTDVSFSPTSGGGLVLVRRRF